MPTLNCNSSVTVPVIVLNQECGYTIGLCSSPLIFEMCIGVMLELKKGPEQIACGTRFTTYQTKLHGGKRHVPRITDSYLLQKVTKVLLFPTWMSRASWLAQGSRGSTRREAVNCICVRMYILCRAPMMFTCIKVLRPLVVKGGLNV
jgi:hypothetical protein